MKLVIQRVTHAEVVVEEQTIGSIGTGYLVLCGICDDDNEQVADKMLQKMLNLRIFADENGKTNKSLRDVNGSLLIISQFTLYADCKKGNRPSFIKAGTPEHANRLYEYMLTKCKENGFVTEAGEFGADMKVTLTNDGPFTIVLDSTELI